MEYSIRKYGKDYRMYPNRIQYADDYDDDNDIQQCNIQQCNVEQYNVEQYNVEPYNVEPLPIINIYNKNVYNRTNTTSTKTIVAILNSYPNSKNQTLSGVKVDKNTIVSIGQWLGYRVLILEEVKDKADI